mmetsp:Transcript_28639/g.54126  ORF Transcript_28639/g.54126 Transcript_28639/m.54126 type:complete len:302 (+) Transcript_28639:102-1007(+)
MFLTSKAAVAAVAILALSTGNVNAFAPSSPRTTVTNTKDVCLGKISTPNLPACDSISIRQPLPTSLTQANLFSRTKVEEPVAVVEIVDESSEGDWIDESKKVELIFLGIWGISISAFILINNFSGPWPLAMKQVPERWYFLSHMVGGMLFGGGIILTTCIERLVAKSQNPQVLQFWFDKVPELDGLIVVPALTISMISGTGLSIVRYGGLNVAPPHVGAIFWTLIAFMSWWAATDLTTQATALKAVERMYERYENGEEGLTTPQVVVDRHFSNVVSCFFILILYSFMVLKPGTLIPFPWGH